MRRLSSSLDMAGLNARCPPAALARGSRPRQSRGTHDAQLQRAQFNINGPGHPAAAFRSCRRCATRSAASVPTSCCCRKCSASTPDTPVAMPNGRSSRNTNTWPTRLLAAPRLWPQCRVHRRPPGQRACCRGSRSPACENHDVSIAGHEPRGLLHALLRVPGQAHVHVICVHLGLRRIAPAAPDAAAVPAGRSEVIPPMRR